jgi:hypothetical protein
MVCSDTLETSSLADMTTGHFDPKLWHAIFERDYSQLTVLDHQTNHVAGPTVLAN